MLQVVHSLSWRVDSKTLLEAASKGSETPVMEKEEADPVGLLRIDPSRNRRRLYTLANQPTLFGGASVIRNWGGIGTHGQSMMETFDGQEEAMHVFERLAWTKRCRGYRSADAIGSD